MIRVGSFLLILCACLSIATYLFAIPRDRTVSILDAEIGEQSHLLGARAVDAAITEATSWYRSARAGDPQAETPTPTTGQGSAQSVAAFWAGIYLLLFRAACAVCWLPYLGLFVGPVVLDAMTQRKIRFASFALNSPQMQGLATRLLVLLPLVALLLIVLPVHLPPWSMPALIPVAACLLWVGTVHFAKRG